MSVGASARAERRERARERVSGVENERRDRYHAPPSVRIHIAAKGGDEGVRYRERGRENEIRTGWDLRPDKKNSSSSKDEVSEEDFSDLKRRSFFFEGKCFDLERKGVFLSRKGYYQASLGY